MGASGAQSPLTFGAWGVAVSGGVVGRSVRQTQGVQQVQALLPPQQLEAAEQVPLFAAFALQQARTGAAALLQCGHAGVVEVEGVCGPAVVGATADLCGGSPNAQSHTPTGRLSSGTNTAASQTRALVVNAVKDCIDAVTQTGGQSFARLRLFYRSYRGFGAKGIVRPRILLNNTTFAVKTQCEGSGFRWRGVRSPAVLNARFVFCYSCVPFHSGMRQDSEP